ncbi:hypothetical protein MPSI1_001654 [Malassezia psittaci]|uniref:Uncharacterized protein n=1 Tax=Malassezia psittaci TaxID=1821823 RepID=A0AAF0JDU0_9BASI|nr:hypothetical protein MPSI1_001654 [Malassezia psittaci]
MLDRAFLAVADSAGIPPDYVRLVACLLIAYGLSPILPLLPSASLRHLMNIAVSLYFLVGILHLDYGTANLVASALVIYGIVYFRIGGKRMPWVAFVVEMAHMLSTHLARQLNQVPLTTVEISAMHMVLCMNLTSFAWSCYDGQMRSAKDLDDTQRANAIPKMPSMLSFLGYCFYFPGVLVGPSTRFMDYQRWANNELYLPDSRPPAGRLSHSLKDIVFGSCALGLQGFSMNQFAYQRLADPKDILQSTSIWNRIGFVQLAGTFVRFRYFGLWALSDAACVMSGLGYAGTDAKTHQPVWTRCKNVNVVNVMLANNWKELLDAWNSNTNIWLRENVYKRFAKPGRRPGFKSMMLTFVVSAFWHGISLGYYMTFVLAGFYQYTARLLRKSLRPVFYANTRTPDPTLRSWQKYSLGQIFYTILSIIITQVTVNFAVISFMTLDFKSSYPSVPSN